MLDAFSFERHTLKNGLVVLLQNDMRCPVFSFQTWCRAGSARDPRGLTGMAHLFEHLMAVEEKWKEVRGSGHLPKI